MRYLFRGILFYLRGIFDACVQNLYTGSFFGVQITDYLDTLSKLSYRLPATRYPRQPRYMQLNLVLTKLYRYICVLEITSWLQYVLKITIVYWKYTITLWFTCLKGLI